MSYPLAIGQSPHKFSIQAARVLVVDILDNATLLQMGRAKAAGQCSILLPQPLLVHEHAKALLESELAHIGVSQLLAEGIGHSVQFHGVQLFDRWLV